MNVCIDRDKLSNFLAGTLDDESSVVVEKHVDECANCRERVEQLSIVPKQDGFFGSLVVDKPNMADPFESEPECRSAIARIKSMASAELPSHRTKFSSMPEFIGPYKLLEPIGQGGMGTVFRAKHTKLHREFAIKVLSPLRPPTDQLVARFEREMEAIGQLEHPNIVRATDAGEINNMHYLAMELIDGADLGQLAKRHPTFSVANACEIVRQAALGLQAAHEQKLVHRDVKPSNLMLSPDGRVKVLDMGLALLNDWQADQELTSVGQLMGTMEYMSPEQCDNSHAVDVRSDIYGLGATLFKLLAGKAPFSRERYDSLFKRVAALATQEAPNVSETRADVPEEVAGIVRKMLSRDPGLRYDTPLQVANALRPWCEGADLPRLLDENHSAGSPKVQLASQPGPAKDASDSIESSLRHLDSSQPNETAATTASNWKRWLPIAVLSLIGTLLVSVSIWQLWFQSGSELTSATSEKSQPMQTNQGLEEGTPNAQMKEEASLDRSSPQSSAIGVESDDVESDDETQTPYEAPSATASVDTSDSSAVESSLENPSENQATLIEPSFPIVPPAPSTNNRADMSPRDGIELESPTPVARLLNELEQTQDASRQSQLLSELRRLETSDDQEQQQEIAQTIIKVMKSYDTFAPKEADRKTVVEALATFRRLGPETRFETGIEAISTGHPNTQLFAARTLHETISRDGVASLSTDKQKQLSEAIDNLVFETDSHLRAAAYGFETLKSGSDSDNKLQGWLVEEADVSARSLITTALAQRNIQSAALGKALGEQLLTRPDPKMPFAPKDPSGTALEALLLANETTLNAATPWVVSHFEQTSSDFSEGQTDQAKEAKLAKQLLLLQRCNDSASRAIPALQSLRNMNLKNRSLHDTASRTWDHLKRAQERLKKQDEQRKKELEKQQRGKDRD